MEFIPIKTRIMQPPQDNLFAVLDESLTDLKEGDVVIITSKVVSIHLGLCIPKEEVDKHALTQDEADAYIAKGDKKTRALTIKHHALLFRAGIDESNSGAYYTKLPPDPYAIAGEIRQYLQEKHSLEKLGVIISDSTVLPFRKGVVGTSLGVAGFNPSRTHAPDAIDLFGEAVIETSTNLADALAAGSSIVSGEANECTPIVIARNTPHIHFTETVDKSAYLIDPQKDLYAPLLTKFYKN